VPGRDALRDHPAHRCAHDVRAVDVQRVEEPDGVVGHVVQRVGHVADPAGGQLERPGWRDGVEARRAPDVPVVEPDHEEAAVGQAGAELLVPGDHLRPQPHHEQDGLIGRVPEGLVAEGDVSDGGEALVHPAHATPPRAAPGGQAQPPTVIVPRRSVAVTCSTRLARP
jgi:hypothetical protein